MARERVVTRTIKVQEAVVVCMETTTNAINERVFINTGDIVPEEKLLKMARKEFEDDTHKVVFVKSVKVSEQIYGMLETEFLKVAKIMTDERKFE